MTSTTNAAALMPVPPGDEDETSGRARVHQGPPAAVGALLHGADALRELRERFGVSHNPEDWRVDAGEDEVSRRRERQRVEIALSRLREAEVPTDPLVVLVGCMAGGEDLLDAEQKKALAGICLQVRPEQAGRLNPTLALRAARAWLHGGKIADTELSGNEWLLGLSGGTGTGKSLAAGWILRETTLGGLWVAADDIGRVRAGKGDELFERAVAAPMLVLDEAGVEQAGATDYAIGRVSSLLLKRSQHRRRTVVTSNMARAAFVERFAAGSDGRLASRLNGQPYVMLPNTERDLRTGGR